MSVAQIHLSISELKGTPAPRQTFEGLPDGRQLRLQHRSGLVIRRVHDPRFIAGSVVRRLSGPRRQRDLRQYLGPWSQFDLWGCRCAGRRGGAELAVMGAAVLCGAGVLFVVHAVPTTSTPIAILPTQIAWLLM